MPTLEGLQKARNAFEENEPYNLFYRVATELVDLSLRGSTSLSVAEALAVLLLTWNRGYYQFRPFDHQHLQAIEKLITDHRKILISFRNRPIETFSNEGEEIILNLFNSFEEVLGPAGVSKFLHLLYPQFFPLWDRSKSLVI